VRILFWTTSFWPTIGGLEVLGTEQALELRRRGHEIRVVAQHDGGSLPPSDSYGGIPIDRFPFHSVLADRDVAGIARIRERLLGLMADFRPELIHLHVLGPQAVFCSMVRTGDRPPLLVTRHTLFDRDQNVARETLPYRILDSADWVACPSVAVRDETIRLVPGTANRSSVIPNGARWPEQNPEPLPFSPPRVLCLGRMVELKGFDLAIRAVARVRQQIPSIRLLLIGDGPARSTLQSLASELGLGAAVEFRGWVPPADVHAQLNRGTVLMSPSRVGEAFCVAALQAAQMARPVVGSRLGGLPEVVQHEQNGLLVDPEDVEAFAAAVLRLIGDPETAIRMGTAGRDRARSFTIETYTDAYESLYLSLLQELNDVRSH
jgi:glycosyltransferase involved in cell wall biosynthesis